MINKKQIKLIHIAKAQLQLSEVAYRSMLRQFFEVDSSKELSYSQASTLIDELRKQGFKIVRKPEPRRQSGSNVAHLVSPQELAKIEHLRHDVRWKFHNGYQLWLRKFLRKERITTSREASKVIEALKAMVHRANEQTPELQKTGDPF